MPDKNTTSWQLRKQLLLVLAFMIKVLGSDIWQEWSKGMIPEYIPAPIAGYDAPVIPAEQVDENASDRNRKDQLHSTTS